MTQRRLILLSGMGADGRLMRPIQPGGIDTLTPDHVPPEPNESLAVYAERVAAAHAVGPTDVIGGASFGGMVAAQIASARPVAGLVLLGTCIRPRRLPMTYPWFERFSRWLPDAVMPVRYWRWVLRWRFAPLTPAAEACIIEMAAGFPLTWLRRFGRMAVAWPGVERIDCPVLSIHGDRDRIIPLRCAEPGVVLTHASHAFTLTHAEQTATAIAEFVERLGSTI